MVIVIHPLSSTVFGPIKRDIKIQQFMERGLIAAEASALSVEKNRAFRQKSSRRLVYYSEITGDHQKVLWLELGMIVVGILFHSNLGSLIMYQ